MTDGKRELPEGSGSRVGANATALAARRQEAWQLRTEEGLTYREIGERLGCDQSTACTYVQHILAEHAPTPEQVEQHRAHLIAQASARLGLWAERADALHARADEQRYAKVTERGLTVEEMGPKLYANAVAAERTAIVWAEKLAKWTGIEVLTAVEVLDPMEAAEQIVARAELFLAGVAAVEARRPNSNGNGNGHHPG